MKEFMTHSFHVSELYAALYVNVHNATPKHKKRKYHGLVYQLTSSASYSFSDGKTIIVPPGHIIYLPIGSSYEAKILDDSQECYAINFSVLEPINFPPFIIRISSCSKIVETFKECTALWQTAKPNKYEKCLSLLYSILADMKKEFYKSYSPSAKFKLIQPAIQYIEEHYTMENISIPKLAEICDISDVHFRNVFRSIYETSPHKYIYNLRISRAKELLRCGEYTVSVVAEMCGFSSDSAFSREFKKTTGISPSDYKEQF